MPQFIASVLLIVIAGAWYSDQRSRTPIEQPPIVRHSEQGSFGLGPP